jgi:hypothetical protein
VEWDGEVQQLSWAPRLFLYKRFLSDAECDHLIDKVLGLCILLFVCALLIMYSLGVSA